MEASERETKLLRQVGDAMVGTFFAASKDGERKKALKALRERLLETHGGAEAMAPVLEAAREGLTVTPFHWELEFPEVWERPHPPAPLSLKGEGGGEKRDALTRGIFIDPVKLERARAFRKEPSPSEAHAWELLRDRRCLGLKFRRQHVVEGFIADFLCAQLGLVLEIDGGVHDDPQQAEYDALRTALFESHGLRVLRVPNEQVTPESLTDLLSRLALQGEGGRGGEVFNVHRDAPGGFDAIVGNPPFLGGKRISTNYGDAYRDWLAVVHEEASSNTDLVAHFFRRAFVLLREKGFLGLIATNTLAQGDTRRGGLRWICNHGGTINDATRRLRWPGLAAVVVSVVHVTRGGNATSRNLDGVAVDRITAFLFPSGGNDDPITLAENDGLAFVGCDIKGQGFVFDDLDSEANPLADRERILAESSSYSEVIRPYLGGEEINSSVGSIPHRWVTAWGGSSLEDCRMRWPSLLRIVEAKVKPARERSNRDAHRVRWWQFGDVRPALSAAMRRLPRVLANSQVSSHVCFAWQPTDRVFAHTLNVFTSDRDGFFAILQSRPHELWARFFGSSLEDRLRYTPSDCFETFPFPRAWETNATLEDIGRRYYEHRAALMVAHNEGLTTTCNRFHDPEEDNADILRLRELHAAMDRAVLDAYGWQDIQPTCAFLLDYEEEGDGDDGAPRRKKKPWRYRWPDDVRDEVLARLLALNAERAAEERAVEAAAKASGDGGAPKAKRGGRAKKAGGTEDGGQGGLAGV